MMQPPAALSFVAHLLPRELDAELLKWKKDLHQRYGCPVGLKSPAHITLIAPFWMQGESKNYLLNDVEFIADTTVPFEAKLHYFSAFGKRTLFVDVLLNQPLQDLYEKAQTVCTATAHYKVKKETRVFHPHVTLATRDIKPADFDKAWESFARRTFEAAWIATNVSMLRHNKSHWKVIYTALFNQ